MLIVLGGLTEFDRDLICEPTAKGGKRAKARGVELGRRAPETHPVRRSSVTTPATSQAFHTGNLTA
jgi:DNA invertase Pin-like site-specific DNA recombinase